MDGDTSVKYECRVFDNGHQYQYDGTVSSPDKTVFTCACGMFTVENEDAGTGA